MQVQNQNRDHRITFRLTESESEELKQKSKDAGGVANFVREAVQLKMGLKVKVKKQTDPAIINLTRQLAKVGNNINQIARKLNAAEPSLDKVLLLAHLKSIETQLQVLRLKHAD